MTLEMLINEIIDLDKQIDAGIKTVDLLEKDVINYDKTERYEERIPTLLETKDKLKCELADHIILAFTGYKCIE